MSPTHFFALYDRAGALDQREIDDIAHKLALPCSVKSDCLAVLSTEPGLRVRQGEQAGCIFGTLFDGITPTAARSELTEREQHYILNSGGRALIDDFWGAYVAFLWNDRLGSCHVVRDPVAGLGCYYYDDGNRVFISSRADLLSFGAGIRPGINWQALVGHIARPAIRAPETALIGIREQIGGTTLDLHPGHCTPVQIWTPWRFAAGAIQPSEWSNAAGHLRVLCDGCIQAWGRTARRVVVSVSGGLDSSIVAGSLASAGLDPVCLTMATDDPSGDERPFARLLARHIGCELIECYEELGHISLTRSDAASLPRPVARHFAQSADVAHQRVAAERGADCFMTGGGGDNLFCFLRSVAPVADAYLAWGFRPRTLEALLDVSRLTGVGLWPILRAVRPKARTAGQPHRWPLRVAFLTDDAQKMVQDPPYHPWLAVPTDMPPGKAMHVAWLMAIQNHVEGFGRDRIHPNRAPLLSQPLIEYCLGIASWSWCRGGRDRALARTAYADCLPAGILERRLKGTPTSFAMEIVDARGREFEERLSDGHLAAHGLIDTAAISSFLRRPDPRRAAEYLQLATLIDVEAWIDVWAGRSASAPAALE